MTAAHHRPAPAHDPAPPAAPVADPETVYLRACPGGWSVHLGTRLILLTEAEDDAFQAACSAAHRDSPPARPMLLLSGPSALRVTVACQEA